MAIFAEFVLSAASASQFPRDGLPEIALVGRSNVGKSSMINALVGNKRLARTSNTPGRTQTLNYYRVWPEGKPKLGDPEDPNGRDRSSLKGSAQDAARAAQAFYFVDMPGYGYAKVAASQRRSWQQLIEGYLLNRETLAAVIQVVDLRHPPTRDDIAMWDWLRHYDKVRLCLATKADKVPRNQRPTHARQTSEGLGLRGAAEPLLLFSAEEGLGREELWRWVTSITRQAAPAAAQQPSE